MILEKSCPHCGEVKPRAEFSLAKDKKHGLASWCRECTRQAVRDWYSVPRQKARHNRRIVQRRQDHKQKLVDHYGGCCKDCGGVFPVCVYDFHHLDPSQKDKGWGQVSGKSWEFLEKEIIAKCVMLCSNCHRIRHHG